MGEEWKNNEDHETFKTLNKEIRRIRDANVKEQLELETEYKERIESLEKHCKELWSKNH